MFRRFQAAASAFFAGPNTPAVPVEDDVPASDTGSLSLPPNWAKMWGKDEASTTDRLAAVYGCVNVIASSIAAMPLQLYRKNGDRREREGDHPLARLLDGAPNEAMTWPQLREAQLYQQILRGNAHSRGFWSGGQVREIFPIPQGTVKAKLTDARRIRYEVGANDFKIPTGEFGIPEILHFKALTSDGIEGINPIRHCRIATAAASALARYGKDSAENGQPIRGIITMKPGFKNHQQATDVRRRWQDAMNDATAGVGIPIFEGEDMKWQNVTMTMRDAQFLESMEFSVLEICRIFNVPPHKLQDLSRATFSNIEHLSKEFYMATLVPWITRIEATMNQCLLTAGDRAAGLYLRHNADGLLRGDLVSRSESFAKQIGCGALTPNEARALEDRPPLEGGNQLFVPSNTVPISMAGKITKPEPPPKDEP